MLCYGTMLWPDMLCHEELTNGQSVARVALALVEGLSGPGSREGSGKQLYAFHS